MHLPLTLPRVSGELEFTTLCERLIRKITAHECG